MLLSTRLSIFFPFLSTEMLSHGHLFTVECLVCLWFDNCTRWPLANHGAAARAVHECLRALPVEDAFHLLKGCAPPNPDMRLVLAVARSIDGHGDPNNDAPARWAIDTAARFIQRTLVGRAAGGWGDADVDDDFRCLADPGFPDDWFVAVVVDASNQHDAMDRMVSSVVGNYRLSVGALTFLVRCIEESLVSDDAVTPDFIESIMCHQRHCDGPLLRRFARSIDDHRYEAWKH